MVKLLLLCILYLALNDIFVKTQTCLLLHLAESYLNRTVFCQIRVIHKEDVLLDYQLNIGQLACLFSRDDKLLSGRLRFGNLFVKYVFLTL